MNHAMLDPGALRLLPVKKRRSQAEASPRRFVPGPVEERIFGMGDAVGQQAAESADPETESCRQKNILQQTEFREVACGIGRVSSVRDKIFTTPEIDIGSPAFD